MSHNIYVHSISEQLPRSDAVAKCTILCATLALLLQEQLTRQALQQLLAHSSTSSSSEIEFASDSIDERESDSAVSVAVVTAVLKLRRAAAAMRRSGASAW
jgi:hypothetical protein